MDFKKLCDSKETPLNPKEVVVEFLKYNSKTFITILKTNDDLYKKLLDFLLEKEEKNLEDFTHWYRDFLYEY